MKIHFVLPFILVGPIAQADAVDRAVQEYMKAANVPGVSLAVIRDGKKVKVKGYGFANLEHSVKVKPETIFQSGSVGKQFTAALVMKLVEDGKISLSDPITKYFPSGPESWNKITIRHLLTHTSGLPDPYEVVDFRKDYTEAELLALDMKLPLSFQPGEKWAYSNSGYHVLGFLCSKVGGKFYGDQMVERILRPSGMKTAQIINEEQIIPNRAAGYEVRDGKILNQAWVAPKLNTTADGSLYVSILDMIEWEATLNRTNVLSDAIKTQMWTPIKLNDGTTYPYGFGWMLAPMNNHQFIGHSGSWQGFKTSIMRFPKDKLTVIVLANSSSANPDKIARAVAAHYVPELAPVKPVPIADTNPAATKRLREFFLSTPEEAYKMLDASTQKQVSIEAIRAAFNDLKSTGALGDILLLSTKTEGKNLRLRYRVMFGKSAILAEMVLTPEQKYSGFQIRPED